MERRLEEEYDLSKCKRSETASGIVLETDKGDSVEIIKEEALVILHGRDEEVHIDALTFNQIEYIFNEIKNIRKVIESQEIEQQYKQ